MLWSRPHPPSRQQSSSLLPLCLLLHTSTTSTCELSWARWCLQDCSKIIHCIIKYKRMYHFYYKHFSSHLPLRDSSSWPFSCKSCKHFCSPTKDLTRRAVLLNLLHHLRLWQANILTMEEWINECRSQAISLSARLADPGMVVAPRRGVSGYFLKQR